MAREIKFRGKSMISRWIYGLLTKKKFRNSGRISYAIAKDDCSLGNTIPVTEESIGEFTGFKDIDDKEIFEGDIIQNDAHEEEIYKIITTCGCWCGLISGGDIDDYDDTPTLGWLLDMAPFKVIGNIHDNPELLEGGKADD